MEEHVWFLVELFISGKATGIEMDELAYLLGTHPDLLASVKDFLKGYKDPDPQITLLQRQELLNRAEVINREFIHVSQPALLKHASQRVNGHAIPAGRPKPGLAAMLRNETRAIGELLKITYRQIRRNKTISFINISGLAIGMATAIVIFLWVFNQLSTDQFHKNKDRVYEVFGQQSINGRNELFGGLPSVLGPVLKSNYPQVEEVNRTSGVGSFVLKNGDKRFESKGLLSDANFFKLFDFQFDKGDAATALKGPYNIVLSQQMAQKLFGDQDPMGKIVKIDSTANFTVTGVLKPLPDNTQFNFEYIVPLSYMRDAHWEHNDWETGSVNVYVLMKPGTKREAVNGLFWNVFRNQHVKSWGNAIVQPMTDWYLYSNYENGKFMPGRLVTLRWFALIASLVMLIACINYMNLGTARSAKRAKEVGIRKVAGAGRVLLIKQFLGESVLTALIAAVLAVFLAQVCMPSFNQLISSHLVIPYDNPVFWLCILGFALFTGLIAGSYPAFYLSAYRPVKVLKGILTSAGALIAPRKVMVVVQFTLAIAFIICTVVIYKQINFALHRSKGYSTDNLTFIYIKGDINKNYVAIKHELEQSGAVTDITRTNSPVNDIWTGSDSYTWQGKDPQQSIGFPENFTDKDFVKTTGVELIEGRDIDVSAYPADTAAVLLTQTAVNKMGLKNPVGQMIYKGKEKLSIVGVVKDFVAGWVYNSPSPIIIHGINKSFGAMNLRMNNARPTHDNIAKISAIIRKYNPDYPFAYHFVNEAFALSLQDDRNLGTIAATFTGLTIFISCMGLFALAAFMAENRIKEIGIRKVLGASVAGITTMLSKDFLQLVGISFIIASPIAWWLMNKWLQGYALHIHIGYWIFVLTGAASLLIAILTVGFQSIKAAMLNPVKNLRSE